MKKILLLITTLVALSLTSCKEEGCPPLYTTLTLELVSSTADAGSTFEIPKLELFTLQTYGNAVTKFDIAIDTLSVSKVEDKVHFKGTVDIPFGEYKMWIWGNILDANVYLPNKQSIRMFNNVVGAKYMLLPAGQLNCNTMSKTISGELINLTSKITIQNNIGSTFTSGTTLFISNIYDRVDFNGLYSSSTTPLDNVLQFEIPESAVVPPPSIYIFPQPEEAAAASFVLTYKASVGGGTDDLGVSSVSKDMKSILDQSISFENLMP